MKLLISALFEIRKKYEEIMENDYLHNETKKGKETLLQGLTYSSKV